MDSKLVFKFKPDTDMDTKLKIHIDITVATPCSSKFSSSVNIHEIFAVWRIPVYSVK